MRGFTLPELLVVVALAAVILTLGLPALGTLRANVATVAAGEELVTLLGLARAGAATRGVDAVLCPLVAGGGAHACGVSVTQGWLLFLDRTADGVYRDGEDEVLSVRAFREGAEVQVLDRRGEEHTGGLVYRPDGSVRRPTTFRLCHPGARRSRLVVVSLTGRVRTALDTASCV